MPLSLIAAAMNLYLQLLVLTVSGWINRHQQSVIEYLQTEQIAGISNQPSGAWMTQLARNLTDCGDGFLRRTRHLILDCDPLFTRAFRSSLAASSVKVVRLPSRSPNLNAFAERFVLSVKSERLDRVIPLGERHLRHLLAEYVEHYPLERNHQGLGNKIIEPIPANTNAGEGVVRRRARLGGLLSYYHREAA
jgi:hypothetical protein